MFLKVVFAILSVTSAYCQNLQKAPRSTTSRVSRIQTSTEDPNDIELIETYFPDVEYPSNILDLAKPFYFKVSDSIFDPFPKEVKETFKSISSKKPKENLNVTKVENDISSTLISKASINGKTEEIEEIEIDIVESYCKDNTTSEELFLEMCDFYDKNSTDSYEMNFKFVPIIADNKSVEEPDHKKLTSEQK